MNNPNLPPVRQRVSESAVVVPAKRRPWIWIVALIVAPIMLCGGLGVSGLVWLAYETGNYGSSNHIRITSAARDAFLEAQADHPDHFLYIEEYERCAFRATFVRGTSDYDRVVKVEERGVPLTIDAAPFELAFYRSQPTIIHDGRDDKTQGYEVVLRGLQPSRHAFPGPGRP